MRPAASSTLLKSGSPAPFFLPIAALLLVSCRPDAPQPVKAPPPAPSASIAASPPAAPWFERIPPGSGLDFVHSAGSTGKFLMPEMETGGVGLIDFDQDGLVDVFCVDGGSVDPALPKAPGHRLFRNLGNARFEDVTRKAGIAVPDGFGMGCAVGDFDGDAWPDLYVTQLGSNRLFRNRRDGTFEDVTRKAGVAVRSWSTSAAFVDYDADGHLDLFVVNYIRWSPSIEMECFSHGGRRDYCSPVNYRAPAPTVLLRNRGDGTFEDVTARSGLDRAYGNGFGVATGDFDGNGHVDLYVANDAMPNQLWLNQGDGRFLDDAPLRGCALNALGVPRAGMGVVAFDVQQRGALDLFVTHLVGEDNGLFVNQGGNFLDAVTPDGPMAGSSPYTGFGLAFVDFNHDALPDLYVANGRVRLGADQPDPNDPYAEASTLHRGTGPGRFQLVPNAGEAAHVPGVARGLAAGDLDNDGAIDLVVIQRNGPVRVLRNVAGTMGGWIQLRLVDAQGREVRNAVVSLHSGSSVQWRQAQPNEGYCSSNDPRLHFGLGNATRADRVVVRWPRRPPEEFGPLDARRLHVLQVGTGRAPAKP